MHLTIVDNLANDGVQHSDDESEDELLGDNGCSITNKDNYDDPHVLEEAIEELYHGAKSSIFGSHNFDHDYLSLQGYEPKMSAHICFMFRI